MPNSSNNYDAFYGNGTSGTASNNSSAFADTIGSNTIITASSWEVIEDFDWTAQATSGVLSGAGSLVMGGKTVTQSTAGGTPTMTSQLVNGVGLNHSCTGLAGTGGSAIRWDLVPANYNPGEDILFEILIGNVAFGSINSFLCFGIGSGTNWTNGEWLGAQSKSANAGSTLCDHIVRGYSTLGAGRSFTVAANQPFSTNYLTQVWYDGSYSARCGIADAQATFLPKPVIGNAAPFDAALDIGIAGTGGSVAPVASIAGIFSTALRAVVGVANQNASFTVLRHRISRPTRMI